MTANDTGTERFEDEEDPGSNSARPTAGVSLNYGLATMILVALSLFTVVLLTAAGNLLVFAALLRSRYLRTVSNYLIGNLALSDLLLATTVLPLSGVNECLGRWVFGRTLCNVWLTMDVLYCTASIWNLCAIAFDRFTATLYPIWYRDRRSARGRAAAYAALVWVIAATVCVPPLLGWHEDQSLNYVYEPETGIHRCNLFQTRGYVVYSAFGSFYLPFLVTIGLYFRIFVVLRTRIRKSPGSGGGLGGSTVDSLSVREGGETESFEAGVSKDDSTAVDPVRRRLVKTGESDEVTTRSSSDLDVCPGQTEAVETESGRRTDASQTPRFYPRRMRLSRRQEAFDLDGKTSAETVSTTPPRATITATERRRNFLGGRRLVQVTASQRRQRCYEQREMRATVRMSVIIAVFCGMWIGFFTLYMVHGCCPDCFVPRELDALFFWLGYSNSSVNPILYTIFNEEFRKAFQKILRWNSSDNHEHSASTRNK